MPAGVSWTTYMKFMTTAMIAMMAGSQAVHMWYKPLNDIDIYVQKEKENNPQLHNKFKP